MSQRPPQYWRDLAAAAIVVVAIIVASLFWAWHSTTSAPTLFGAQASSIPSAPSPSVTSQLPPASPASPALPSPPRREGTSPVIKNVVLLLADDLDWAAFDQVPRLSALKAQGTTLSDFVVTDSLCCPSRTSLLRSQFVHNHQVLSNVPQTGGGWVKFYKRNLESDCLPTWLHAAGVDTSLVGKYLNGFPDGAPTKRYVPPGWDYFVTSTSGAQAYRGYNYTLNVNGALQSYGSQPADFLNDVLTQDATAHLAHVKSPFFLELASYNPHIPSPVAVRNAGKHATDTVPRTPSFKTPGTNEVRWLAGHPVNSAAKVAHFDRLWTRRLGSAESIADSYDALSAQLKATGHDKDTLVIITSDNGYHAGVHRLSTGKNTAFHEDTVVPALFIGPDIAAGRTINAVTSMVDLAPTISGLLGAQTPTWVDGRDLMPLLTGTASTPWRTATLTENLGNALPGDPDYEPFQAPPFHALRSRQWLYVEYLNGDRELYNEVADPFEMHNIYPTTKLSIRAQLHAQLKKLVSCAGPSCRIADSAPQPVATSNTRPSRSPIASSPPLPSPTTSTDTSINPTSAPPLN